MYKIILLFSVFFFLLFNLTAQEISALQIIRNVYNRPSGDDQTANLTMTLINSRGDKRIREIRQFLKNYPDMEKKIMFFTAPADVYNTSFMNWSYNDENKNDDKWIYLPALKRVKRISSESSSEYFMGSDFTYDDLGERQPQKDLHSLMPPEIIDGIEYHVVQSIPVEDEYIYSRTVTWIDKNKWIGKKKEFYDQDGKLLKILSVLNVQNINGFDVITNSEMHNLQTGHKTQMTLNDIQINSGIDDETFTERLMKRGL